MHILHISDIHFRRSYTPAGSGYEQMLSAMTNPLITLDRCLDAAFSAHPKIDLVMISGDLCDDGEARDYRALREHLDARLGAIPVLVTLGNHDRKDAFREGWLCREDGKTDCVSDAPYNSVLKIQGMYAISLDSSVFGNSNGCLSSSQSAWLKEQLQEIGSAPSILLTHHHLIGAHESIPPLPEAEELRETVQESGIIGVMCGHTHHCFAGYWGGKLYYTSDGMSFYGTDQPDGRVKFEEKYGYNYYCIENGCITHSVQETFSAGKVLGMIRMKNSEKAQ